MKIIIILSVCVMACAAEHYKFPKDDYTGDKLRRDEIEFKNRLDCYLDRELCTPLTAEHKKFGTEIVRTACAQCPSEFKEIARAFIEVAREKFPEEYGLLRSKYDASGQYYKNFEEAIGVSHITA